MYCMGVWTYACQVGLHEGQFLHMLAHVCARERTCNMPACACDALITVVYLLPQTHWPCGLGSEHRLRCEFRNNDTYIHTHTLLQTGALFCRTMVTCVVDAWLTHTMASCYTQRILSRHPCFHVGLLQPTIIPKAWLIYLFFMFKWLEVLFLYIYLRLYVGHKLEASNWIWRNNAGRSLENKNKMFNSPAVMNVTDWAPFSWP